MYALPPLLSVVRRPPAATIAIEADVHVSLLGDTCVA